MQKNSIPNKSNEFSLNHERVDIEDFSYKVLKTQQGVGFLNPLDAPRLSEKQRDALRRGKIKELEK
jgi:hypothetical protein